MTIRLANSKDLSEYTNLLQTTYQHAYTNDELGLSKDCFSKEIFNTKHTQDYLRSHLIDTNTQKTWLAFKNKKMVGSITCIIKNYIEAELTGFYVLPKFQNQGIGKELYTIATDFAEKRKLVLDIYCHNEKTISIYKKWGWKIDKSKGNDGFFYRNWPEWPKDLKAKCVYMIKR